MPWRISSRRTPAELVVLAVALGCVSVPSPPSGLPHPYKGARFEPESEDQEEYFRYLEQTPMIPARQFCEETILPERIGGDPKRASAEWTWTEDPILAQGTGTAGMFSLTEAHVVYRDRSDRDRRRATFSCFVQYAGFRDKKTWRAGYLRYGGCLEKGHRRFIMCVAWLPWTAPPGSPSRWQEGILRP